MTTKIVQTMPYLFFRGRCEEAVEFYRAALGAEVEMMMRFSESPEPVPPGMLQEGFESKIMHCTLRIGESRVLASDGCNEIGSFSGFSLALHCQTEEEARRAFDALAEGGNVETPLGPTFWSPCYGMLTDRFEVEWMVMVLPEA